MTTPADFPPARPSARDDDEVLARLRHLPVPAPGDLAAARVRRLALQALARERRYAAHPALSAVDRVFTRVVEPALVAGIVGVYLGWAVQAVEALYR
jgi:hypothetical protein